MTRVTAEPYRHAFGVVLPKLIKTVFTTNDRHVREKLRMMRQFWDTIIPFEYLRALDDEMRAIDQSWPSCYQRQLLAQLNEVNARIADMRLEVDAVEMEARNPTIQPIALSVRSIMKPTELSQQKRTNSAKPAKTSLPPQMKSGKRKRATFVDLKKLQYDGNTASSNGNSVENVLSSQSSVLLTPSPEPCDRLTPPELTINKTSDTADSDFWLSMQKIEEQNQQKSSNIFNFMPDGNRKMPFLFDLFEKSAEPTPKSPEKESVGKKLKTMDEAEESKKNVCKIEPIQIEEMPTMDLGLDFEVTAETSNNFVLDADDGIDIQQVPCQLDDSEKQVEPAKLPRTTPSPPSIDGIIDVEPCRKQTAHKIKINLVSQHLIEATSASLHKKLEPVKEVKRTVSPTEWKTPIISYTVKDSMKNVKFQTKPIRRRDIESSGMCSIM